MCPWEEMSSGSCYIGILYPNAKKEILKAAKGKNDYLTFHQKQWRLKEKRMSFLK